MFIASVDGRYIFGTTLLNKGGVGASHRVDASTPATLAHSMPPHNATGHTWHHTDSDLIGYITLGGEAALAQMGVAFDSGMPAFGDLLSEGEVVYILEYIKSR